MLGTEGRRTNEISVYLDAWARIGSRVPAICAKGITQKGRLTGTRKVCDIAMHECDIMDHGGVRPMLGATGIYLIAINEERYYGAAGSYTSSKDY